MLITISRSHASVKTSKALEATLQAFEAPFRQAKPDLTLVSKPSTIISAFRNYLMVYPQVYLLPNMRPELIPILIPKRARI